MMSIKNAAGNWINWWLGYGIPHATEGNVVTFQADGDELNLIIHAMAASATYNKNGIAYKKGNGVGEFFIERDLSSLPQKFTDLRWQCGSSNQPVFTEQQIAIIMEQLHATKI